MADDREPYEPLWATGLARRPEPAGPPPEPAPEPRRPLWPAALVAALLLVLAAVTAGSGRLTVADLPSSWGTVPMTCTTARIEGRTRTVELFHCRALAGTLPPGVYRSPETTWRSDVDHRPALRHVIHSTGRELTGRAVYVP